MPLLLALTASWLALAALLGIVLARAIRAADQALDYDTDGYRVADIDLVGQNR